MGAGKWAPKLGDAWALSLGWGRVDPCRQVPSPRVVTMPNLVALDQTVWSQKKLGRLEPHPLKMGYG